MKTGRMVICGMVVLLMMGIMPAAAEEWVWAADGWDGWSHTASWSGMQTGPCSEYGPVVVDGQGRHGVYVTLNQGSTTSSVERTFIDPSGPEWNSLTFKGSITASDVPGGRWVAIDINGQRAFYNNAVSNPPGNGQDFEIKCYFPKTQTLNIKISQGQDPAWWPYFGMNFYSLTYDSLKFTEDKERPDPGFAMCEGSTISHPVPEFPSALMPVTLIIGFLGAILLIWRAKEN